MLDLEIIKPLIQAHGISLQQLLKRKKGEKKQTATGGEILAFVSFDPRLSSKIRIPNEPLTIKFSYSGFLAIIPQCKILNIRKRFSSLQFQIDQGSRIGFYYGEIEDAENMVFLDYANPHHKELIDYLI